MKNKDIARAALAVSVVAGCAASIDSMRAHTDTEYEIAATIANGADVATAAIGLGLGVDALVNRPTRRPTVRRKTRTRKS
ncbi:MAG: hypothetical protein AAF766_22935 [Cyanobacteria bacterium P01_D01_bin.14]